MDLSEVGRDSGVPATALVAGATSVVGATIEVSKGDLQNRVGRKPAVQGSPTELNNREWASGDHEDHFPNRTSWASGHCSSQGDP